MKRFWIIAAITMAMIAAPALAKDSLGTFDFWGAFRDPQVPRCYAIAKPEEVRGSAKYKSYASIGYWPKRRINGQLHFRLSRDVSKNSAITLRLGARIFRLTGGGGDAWAKDKRMDAAIIAGLRSATTMQIIAIDRSGNTIRDKYNLRGVATAMDAAALGCARLR